MPQENLCYQESGSGQRIVLFSVVVGVSTVQGSPSLEVLKSTRPRTSQLHAVIAMVNVTKVTIVTVKYCKVL